jgi:hypothetical protein
VGLLSHCAWWARPEAEWSTTRGDAADRGTRFHAAIAAYVNGAEVAPLADDIAQLFIVAREWVDAFGNGALGRSALAAEVAFAWDPVTDTAARIDATDRDYSAAPGKLCGTADLVAVARALRVGYIADWSTGDGSQKGPQLRALALALARTEGLDMVTVEALEVDSTGVRHVCRQDLDAFALAAVAGELAEGLAAVDASEPQPGPHCADLYCPARATCPAVLARVAEIVPAEALTRHRWGVTIQSADHAMWLYNQAKAVEAAAKLVKDAVKAYVPEDGVVLADGTTLIEGTRNMNRFDKDRAIGLLRAKGATAEEIEACTRQVVESAGLKVVGGAAKSRKRRAA